MKEEKIEELEEKTTDKCTCHEDGCKHHDNSSKEPNHECKCHGNNSKKEKNNKLEEELKVANDNIIKLQEENKNLLEKVKLAQAELINYRRRKDEETLTTLKYANKDLILELISVVDNFERAIKLDDNDLTDELSKFLAGFKIMYATLMDILKKFGVEEINRAGEIFDPTLEEALLTDTVEDRQDEEVLEVLLKGYKLKDRVIRPASVKINQL